MITKCKTISALLVLIFSNSLSAQTAEFDPTSGYLTIPLLKLGADVYEQVRFQYDGNLDFNVVDFAKKTESDAKTNATFDGSTLDLKLVKVQNNAYSNLEFAFKPPLKFSITKVQEPLPIGRNSLNNRESKVWANIVALRSKLQTQYIEKYNSWASQADASVYLDIDLDGDDDIFVANFFYPKTGGYTLENYGKVPGELWVNNGDENFSLDDGTLMPNMPMFEHARKVITADLNGDSVPDIVVADHGFDAAPFPGSRLIALLSNIDGSHTTKIIEEGGFHHGVSAGDFDSDGDVDLFSVAKDHGGIFLNDGLGSFTSAALLTEFNNKSKFYNTVSFDVDNDGKDDIIVLPDENENPRILYQGSEGFKNYSELILPSPDGYGTINDAGFMDLNSDGIKDIVINATGSRSSSFYKGNIFYGVLLTEDRSAGATSIIYKDEDYSEDWVRFIRIEDIDGNGSEDIISSEKNRNFVFLTDKDGKFEKKYAFVSPKFESWDIKIDINNDGHQDIITRQAYAHPDTITYGSAEEFIDKNERYLELSPIPGFEFTFKLTPGDLNADGYTDLVATATNTSTGSQVGCAIGVHFLFGKELNEYRTVYSDEESGTCYEAKLVDTDSDGDLDITTKIIGGAQLTLINDGEGRFTLFD